MGGYIVNDLCWVVDSGAIMTPASYATKQLTLDTVGTINKAGGSCVARRALDSVARIVAEHADVVA